MNHFASETPNTPVTTLARPPVFGNYTQCAVFWHEIRLDTQENAKAVVYSLLSPTSSFEVSRCESHKESLRSLSEIRECQWGFYGITVMLVTG
jgi:hypothetical protein